jgi:tetratricopeptide (TPR) repeat protein
MRRVAYRASSLIVLIAMIISLTVACGQAKALQHYNQGVEHHEQGQLDLAVVEYNQAIELDPQLTDAFINRGFAYYNLGDLDQAIDDFDQAIELDPQNSLAYSNRGIAYYELGDLDQAIDDFDQAIELDAQNAMAYSNRGLAYSDLGDLDQAIDDFDQAIELDPQISLAYSNRGLAYSALGDLDQAIDDFDQAIEVDPQNSLAYSNRGLAYHNLGDLDQAIADCDQAIELDPQLADAYINRGLAYCDMGNLNQGIADYDQAITLDPQNPLAYNNRGYAYRLLEDLDRAIDDYDRAIALDPQFALAFLNRGNAHLILGNLDQAIADCDQAISLDPLYAEAYANRGLALSLLDELEQAVSDLETSLELGLSPDIEQIVREVIKEIEQILPGASEAGGYLEIAYPSSTPLSEDHVIFQSNAFAEYTGVAITFQHPRDWQAGYFSDSGYSGWLVSDAEPVEAFWYTNRTFDEIVIHILPMPIDGLTPSPAEIFEDAGFTPREAGFSEYTVGDRTVAIQTEMGEVSGAVIRGQMAFIIFGDFPDEQEAAYETGIETVFNTLDWIEIGDTDVSNVWLAGTRLEGQLELGADMEGHVQWWSTSEWTFEGTTDQEIALTISAQDQVYSLPSIDDAVAEARLLVDVLDGDGISILTSGPISFTGRLEMEPIGLPADGAYTLQVYAQDDWFGRYQISVE